MTTEQIATDIVARIHQLESLQDESLRHAMDDLQAALLANPAAVALMLPTDIGLMVVALRRIVGAAIAAVPAKKPPKPKDVLKSMTPEQMQAAFDEL